MGVIAIRPQLRSVPRGAAFDHPGLALARYLEEHADTQQKREGKRPEVRLLDLVTCSPASDAYRAAFARWQNMLVGAGVHTFFGTAITSLAVGLGNESPLEVGLRLHHTYGMPLIPGSALKGLCRRAAGLLRDQGQLSEEQFAVLFGSPETNEQGNRGAASYLVFWDAWYDPGSVDGRPFKRDVITVHHPEYYQSRGEEAWPTDFNDPNPVPFLVIRPQARFLFALSASDQGWGNFAVRLLEWSLVHLGVGAKTSAGYGYFADVWQPIPTPPPLPTEETWPECTLRREIVKGAVRVCIEGGPEPLQVEQADWQPIEQGLPPEKRDAFRQAKVLRATVRVRREAGRVLIRGVEPR